MGIQTLSFAASVLICLVCFIARIQNGCAFSPAGVTQNPVSKTNHPWSPLFALPQPRRDVLLAGGALLTGTSQPQNSLAAPAIASRTAVQPLADLPMIRIRPPANGVGREYVGLQLMIQGRGPFDFMVDSGLTTELITPHLQNLLKLQSSGTTQRGLAAGGSTTSNAVVNLQGASICCGNFMGGRSELPLPNLRAVITNFPQEHIDPQHDPVEGMIGMELLSLFDVEFDFRRNRLRLWQPGTAARSSFAQNMVEIPAVVINETGLIGIRLLTPGATQPILAFLDSGSTFSYLNWAAAELLGLPGRNDPVYRKNPAIVAVGIDGRPLQLPTIRTSLTFVGDVQQDNRGRPVGFDRPPPYWKPWDSVPLAVGDLPAFSSILGDGRTPFKGPAALIGLDVLGQRRIILETGANNTRRRRLLVESS